ncbi:MAG: hypothetical protein IKY33_02630 [Clostridia bacterium]|nr:hypothetical protein [Clostridia bacterium]
MIKGIGKRVVVLTDPNSKIYEQAIFILRQDRPDIPCDRSMLDEAERIINTHIFASAMRPRRRRQPWLPVLIISITVSLLVGVSVLIFALL